MVQTHSSYTKGLDDETLVIDYLSQLGYRVTRSTQHENITKDIDCFVDYHPTSIKVMHNGNRADNVGFEMYQFRNNQWTKSGWFYTGHATQYIIWHKTGDIVKYNKEAVKNLIESGTLKSGYKTQLREETCVAQAAIGHGCIDAESYYVTTRELVTKGAAQVIGHLNFKGMTPFSTTPRKKQNVC